MHAGDVGAEGVGQARLETAARAARAAGAVVLAHADSVVQSVEVKLGDRQNLVSEVDREAQAAAVRTIAQEWPAGLIVGEEAVVQVAADGSLRDLGPPEHDERLNWSRPAGTTFWLIDGLDGTVNYLRRLRPFCTSVAYVEDGRPIVGAVYDPITGDLFTVTGAGPSGRNGGTVRVSGATALEGAVVATETPRRFWDVREPWPRELGTRGFGSPIMSLAWVASGGLDAYVYLPADGPQRVGPWDLAAGALLVERAGGVVTGHDGRPFDVWQRGVLAAATPELHGAILRRLRG